MFLELGKKIMLHLADIQRMDRRIFLVHIFSKTVIKSGILDSAFSPPPHHFSTLLPVIALRPPAVSLGGIQGFMFGHEGVVADQWEEVVSYFPQPPLPCGRAEDTSLGDARSRGLHCLRFSSGWGSWGGCLWEHCRSGQNKKKPCVQPGVAIPLSSALFFA